MIIVTKSGYTKPTKYVTKWNQIMQWWQVIHFKESLYTLSQIRKRLKCKLIELWEVPPIGQIGKFDINMNIFFIYI